MALSYNVFTDLDQTCAPAEGQRPGRYLLEEAILEYGGVKHGISGYTNEVVIFEDIDKPGITGWVELMDVDNLISAYIKDASPAGGPHTIVGQELLYLKFKTWASDFSVDFMDHPLHIHKIENLRFYEPGTGATSTTAIEYRIHFCAPELLNNERVRVSQAYEDTYSEIVKDIMKTHLKTAKDVWVEDTKDIVKVVFPNMHPFDAIRALCTQVKNKKESLPNYNFYETTKGYRFKTMHAQATKASGGRRVTGGNDRQMYYSIPAGALDGPYMRHMISPLSHQWLRIGDTYQEIRAGMFASKSIEHDSYHKVVHHGSARYTDDLPSKKHKYTKDTHIMPGVAYVPTGEHFPPQVPLHNIPVWHESKRFDEFPDSRIFFKSTGGVQRFQKAGDNGVVSHGSLGDPDQLTRNLYQMQQRHDRYSSIQLEVWGLSGLQAGDCVNLDTPTMGVDKTKLNDQRFSEDYYITKLVHRVNLRKDQAEYKQTLVMSPKGPGRGLPGNGNLTGGDPKTGEIAQFFNKQER